MTHILRRLPLYLLAALCCAACQFSEPLPAKSPVFLGAWGLESTAPDSGLRIYRRLDSLSGDRDGYFFGTDGKLLVRNAGWCGTPPLTYANHIGSWIEEKENMLRLTHPHLKAMGVFRLEILSLDTNEMQCRIEHIEQTP